MKVLIVNNMSPFIWGGAEELAVNLQKNIERAGHLAEILRIPFQWDPAEKIPSQILMCKQFELSNVDRVIALKFPAYTIRHPNKILWLLENADDFLDEEERELKEQLRKIIHTVDHDTYSKAKKIFVNDIAMQKKLKQQGFNSKVLLPPSAAHEEAAWKNIVRKLLA